MSEQDKCAIQRKAVAATTRQLRRDYGPLEERPIELTTEAEWEALTSPILKSAAALCEIAPMPALIEGRDYLRALIEGRIADAVAAMIRNLSTDELRQLLHFHERAIQKRVQ